MEEDRLDESNQEEIFNVNTRIVAIKYFYFESQARLYAARLEEFGINWFISNANTGTVIPIGEGSIGLHVKASDIELAQKIIKKLDAQASAKVVDENFRDADEGDIAYERKLYEEGMKPINYYILLLLIVGLILLVFYNLNNSSTFFG